MIFINLLISIFIQWMKQSADFLLLCLDSKQVTSRDDVTFPKLSKSSSNISFSLINNENSFKLTSWGWRGLCNEENQLSLWQEERLSRSCFICWYDDDDDMALTLVSIATWIQSCSWSVRRRSWSHGNKWMTVLRKMRWTSLTTTASQVTHIQTHSHTNRQTNTLTVWFHVLVSSGRFSVSSSSLWDSAHQDFIYHTFFNR